MKSPVVRWIETKKCNDGKGFFTKWKVLECIRCVDMRLPLRVFKIGVFSAGSVVIILSLYVIRVLDSNWDSATLLALYNTQTRGVYEAVGGGPTEKSTECWSQFILILR